MPGAHEEIESEGTRLVDFRLISLYVRYATGAVRRRRRLVWGVFAAIFLVASSSLYLLPKTYHVETKLLAQKNQALAVRGDNQELPIRAAVETVMRRDNLIAIIRQTDLVHQWYNRRAPLMHAKDVVFHAISKPESEQDTAEWQADLLEKKLSVWTNEGNIDISVDWPDPTMALRLVDAAQQSYLESRHATEITAIAEQVSILQNHATTLRDAIDTAVDAIETLRAERSAKPAPTLSAGASPTPAPAFVTTPAREPTRSADPDPELAQLKVMIEGKQRAVNELEDFRRRRLSELNASLAEKQAMYTDNHPVLIDLRQTIASLSTESPQVQTLRGEIRTLQKEFDDKSARAVAESRSVPVINTGVRSSAPPPLPGSIIRIEQEPTDDRDPAMARCARAAA